eukprot:4573409-Prymnesium_polylepis.1
MEHGTWSWYHVTLPARAHCHEGILATGLCEGGVPSGLPRFEPPPIHIRMNPGRRELGFPRATCTAQVLKMASVLSLSREAHALGPLDATLEHRFQARAAQAFFSVG